MRKLTHLGVALLLAASAWAQDGEKPSGYLGVQTGNREDSKGVNLTRVMPGTPAEKAGLKEGDVVLKVGEAPITSREDLGREIRKNKAGDTISLVILRSDEEQTIEATLAGRRGRRGPRGPAVIAPSEFYEDEREGPEAALDLEKSLRRVDPGEDRSPTGSVVDLKKCTNITPLSQEMWTKEQVLEDFEKTRTEEQVGAIVFLKTEFCCAGSRLCAVTTSVFEKRATPLLRKFKVYGCWIKYNPDHEGEEGRAWEKKMIDEYGFVQGPGARVVTLIPSETGDPVEEASNANRLKFSWRQWEKQKGKAPELEKLLNKAMERAGLNKEIPKGEKTQPTKNPSLN